MCLIEVTLHFSFTHQNKFMKIIHFLSKILFFLAVFTFSTSIFAQKIDTIPKHKLTVFSAVSVTNNGISLIPSFSLGKPAAIFDIYLKKKRLSFEPQFRASLAGKPWSFVFWWRYKLIKTDKFSLGIGAHPAVLFRTASILLNNIKQDVITAQRFLATEIVPNYHINKNVSVGVYYLYSHSLENVGLQTTNFVTLNANFSHISLYKDFFAKFYPQVFYLKMDKNEGYYTNATLIFEKKNFPISLSFIGNQKIKSSIAGAKFIWNATLTYALNRKFKEE